MNRDLSSRSNKSRTLSSELAQVLVDRIRGGDYPPGTKLPKEASIMEEFGVSRTVVREASPPCRRSIWPRPATASAPSC
ncbi:transcriptional regulator NanR [Hydrogenophaga sp. T4]|nr:transcriptional regulator NanR [Hydrogenophaga sp. T4]